MSGDFRGATGGGKGGGHPRPSPSPAAHDSTSQQQQQQGGAIIVPQDATGEPGYEPLSPDTSTQELKYKVVAADAAGRGAPPQSTPCATPAPTASGGAIVVPEGNPAEGKPEGASEEGYEPMPSHTSTQALKYEVER